MQDQDDFRNRVASPSPIPGLVWGIGGPALSPEGRIVNHSKASAHQAHDTAPLAESASMSPSPSPRRDPTYDPDAALNEGSYPPAPAPAPLYREEVNVVPAPAPAAAAPPAEPVVANILERIKSIEEGGVYPQPQVPVSNMAAALYESRPLHSPARVVEKEREEEEEVEEVPTPLPAPTPLEKGVLTPTSVYMSPAVVKKSTKKRSRSAGTVPRKVAAAPVQVPAVREVVKKKTERTPAVAHTARSYQMEKQKLVKKYEDELSQLRFMHEEEVRTLRRQMSRVNADHQARRADEVGSLEAVIRTAAEETLTLHQDMQALATENSSLVSSLEEARARIKRMDHLRNDDKARVMATLDNWKKHYESSEATQKAEVSTLNDRICELTAQLVSFEHIKNELNVANDEKNNLRQQLEVFKAQLESSTLRSREQDAAADALRLQVDQAAKEREEVASLQHMVSGLRKNVARGMEEKAVLEERLREVQAEVNQRIAGETALQAQLSAANQAIGGEKMRDLEVATQYAHHQAELEAALTRERELQRDKEALRNETLQMSTRLHHAESAAESHVTQLRRALEDNERLRRAHPLEGPHPQRNASLSPRLHM